MQCIYKNKAKKEKKDPVHHGKKSTLRPWPESREVASTASTGFPGLWREASRWSMQNHSSRYKERMPWIQTKTEQLVQYTKTSKPQNTERSVDVFCLFEWSKGFKDNLIVPASHGKSSSMAFNHTIYELWSSTKRKTPLASSCTLRMIYLQSDLPLYSRTIVYKYSALVLTQGPISDRL